MTFKNKVRESFIRAKQDVSAFKENVTGWLRAILSRQEELEFRISVLESRVKELEKINKIRIYNV